MSNTSTTPVIKSEFFEGIQHVINPEAEKRENKSILVVPVGMTGHSLRRSLKRWNKERSGQDTTIERLIEKKFGKEPEFVNIPTSPGDAIFDSDELF